MRAAWLEDNSLRYREDLPVPDAPPGEAWVRVRLAGICSTDLELVRGYYPFTGVLGHEFVGVVEASPAEPAWEGKRVVGEINAACGHCRSCRAGLLSHCENRTVLGIVDRNGAFAEYLTLPLENLHVVPANVSDEAAVFTEPLAAALEIQEQIQIRPSDKVLVIGAGRLGQLIAQTLRLTGCGLWAVIRHSKHGALLASQGVPILLENEIPARELDLVVDATGSPDGFALARRAVRPRGTIVLKSTYQGERQVNFSSLVVDEITLIGSRCGPFPPALRLLETRQVDPLQLIQARYLLAQAGEAFAEAGQPGALKVLLQPFAP